MPLFQNPTVDFGGLAVDAFGDLVMHEWNPIMQFDFVYGGGGASGIYTAPHQVGVSSSSGTGAAVTAGSVGGSALTLASGTAAGAAGTTPTTGAVFTSTKVARYRPGQAIQCRFSAVFGAATNHNGPIVGAGNTVDGYFFGNNPTGGAWGILHRRASSDATAADGLVGWVAASAFSEDKLDGTGPSAMTIDTTKWNVFQIRYPYLGAGPIKFYVLNPVTSTWILCHVIKYPNSSTIIQITNPGLQFYATNTNDATGSAGTTLKIGSVNISISGMRLYLGPVFGDNNSKATITTETNIISIRNCTTFNGVTNRGILRLRSISFAAALGTGIGTLRVLKGTTIGGAPSFTTVSGTTADAGVTITSGLSMASRDVAGTTVSGGTVMFNGVVAGAGGTAPPFDLTPFDIFVNPGETISLAMGATAAATCAVAINWNEDQ
jgi:hypothetical protein